MGERDSATAPKGHSGRDVAGNFLDKLAVLDRHPLVEYGITEAQCLDYCLSKGYDFGGRYNHFARVSCFAAETDIWVRTSWES